LLLRGGAAALPFAGSSSFERFARARNGGGGNLVGMGKAGHLARNAAQAEARIARIIGRLQPPVVRAEALAGDELQNSSPSSHAASASRTRRRASSGVSGRER
jgi:hypothetical protein